MSVSPISSQSLTDTPPQCHLLLWGEGGRFIKRKKMFVEGELGIVIERIMSQIKEHLKEDEPNHPIHYNRTYEVILRYLREYIPEK